MKKKKIFIVYFSPAGSTRHVAEVIEKQFLALGAEVSSFDLAECSSDVATTISLQMEASEGKSCLFIGSPVYVSHAVPLVMEFIAGLKENTGAFAVPFVTWGGACSGISLYEMGKELLNKGLPLLGAAKVLAVHSLMWPLENALGKGHPDADDDQMVKELVDHINQKLHEDHLSEQRESCRDGKNQSTSRQSAYAGTYHRYRALQSMSGMFRRLPSGCGYFCAVSGIWRWLCFLF